MVYQCHCKKCGKDFIRQRNRGDMEICSPCQSRVRVRTWKISHPERVRTYKGYFHTPESYAKYGHSLRGLETARERQKRRYWKDPEKSRERNRTRYAMNRDKEIQKTVNRSKRLVRATPSWANLDSIAEIYAKARRLTLETGIEHHVDHIIPLNGKNVSGLHILSNLRIVTAKENKSKGNKLVLAIINGID